MSKPTLPIAIAGTRDAVMIAERSTPMNREQLPLPSEVAAQRQFEADPSNKISVPDQLQSPNPLIRQTRQTFRGIKVDDYGVYRPLNAEYLAIRVSPDSLDRALRIMDTLVKALVVRGYEVTIQKGKYPITNIEVLGQKVTISLHEEIHRRPHKITAAEEAQRARRRRNDDWSWFDVPRWDFEPTGYLALKIDEHEPSGSRKSWKDCDRYKIEDILNEFIVGVVITADAMRIRALKWERQQREWEEQRCRNEEDERLRREEEARRRKLEEQARSWAMSQEMRAFIVAVELSTEMGPSNICHEGLQDWLAWARAHADRLDPIKSGLIERLIKPKDGEPDRS